MKKELTELLREEGLPLNEEGVVSLSRRHVLNPIEGMDRVKDEVIRVLIRDTCPVFCPRFTIDMLELIVLCYPEEGEDEEIISLFRVAREELR